MTTIEGPAPSTDDIDDMLAALLPPDARSITVADGEDLCRSGDPSDMWWYIDDGWADVTADGIFLGNVGTGETVGEISALDGRPRTATVTARGEMRLRVASAGDLHRALEASPDAAVALTRLMVRRLRDTNERTIERIDVDERATPSSTATGVQSTPFSDAAVFDPFVPGYFDDPSVQLGAIREREAVHFVDTTGAFMLTRYEHVQPLGRDRRLGNDIAHALPNPGIDAEREMLARANPVLSILRVDGDDHSRVRRIMQKAFTPKVIALWRDRAVSVADDLLDRMAAAGGGDLIDDYALQLPVQIISDMLGMPTDDVPQLREWSHRLTKTLDPLCAPEDREAAVEARWAMDAYVANVYDVKRQQPDDGLMSLMIRAEDEGDRLSRAELLVNTTLLFVAGHETTTNLIGNGSIELFRHPDQRAVVEAEPDLDANLVEEVLRYNSPVQFTRRISREDIVVDDVEIPAGSVLSLCGAAANRDPRKWGPTADEFIVRRAGANDQVSFGGGPHFCLGAALARLEGQVALGRLFRRFPTLQPTTEPVFEPRIVLRGVAQLPVSL
jgi:cytochrome P450